jgi:hypothetical protein
VSRILSYAGRWVFFRTADFAAEERERGEREILTSEIRVAQVVVLCCCLDKLITSPWRPMKTMTTWVILSDSSPRRNFFLSR